METPLLGSAAARNSVESLYAEHGPDYPWPYWLLLFMMLASVVLLATLEIDVSIRIAGVFRPKTEQVTVRSGVNGVVRRMQVSENQAVQADQTLLVIDSQIIDQEMSNKEQVRRDNIARAGDYGVLIKGWGPRLDWSAQAGSKPPSATVPSPFVSPDVLTSSVREDGQQLAAIVANFDLQINRASREYDRALSLHQKALISEDDLDQKKYDFEKLMSDRKIAIQQYLAKWEGQVQDLTLQNDALGADMRQLRAQKIQYEIKSPVTGTALGFSEVSTGSFISAGQTVGNISPNNEVVAEGMVATRDVGLIRPGQTARVQVDAFPYTEWGQLEGTIETVADDTIRSAQSPQFKVVVHLDHAELTSPKKMTVSVRKGMTGLIRVVVAKRKLWRMLWEKTSDWIDPYGTPTGTPPPVPLN